MKLHQLRYLREIARQNLSVSQAADALHTSQPGVSKQIQLLEEELKLQIFQRNGKRLTGITEPGRIILDLAERVMRELENIKRVGEEFTHVETGTLTVATTHTQARYYLPAAVKSFMQTYPGVKLTIHQGNPTQVTEQVASGEADIGIATEAISRHESLFCLPCAAHAGKNRALPIDYLRLCFYRCLPGQSHLRRRRIAAQRRADRD